MDEIMKLPDDTRTALEKMEDRAKSLIVRNNDERALLFNEIKSAKTYKDKVLDFFRDIKKKADEAHKAIVKQEKSFTDKIDVFESAAKRAILAFDHAEEAKRIAEQKRLQAIADEKARKEREKAEAEAARQRQVEEDARRKAEEARRLAEAADAAERARLLKEAEAEERRASAANAKAEAKTEIAAAVTAPVIEVAKTIEKQNGESTAKIWKARVIDANLVPREWLIVDEKAVNAFARATKGAKQIPGIEIYSESSLKIGSR
jgi:hypothetical protein